MGAGTWDYMGSDTFQGSTSVTGREISSGGGDYKVELSGVHPVMNWAATGSVTVKLYEKDTFGRELVDTKTLTFYSGKGEVVFTNLNSWTDGIDGKAEFVVEISGLQSDYKYTAKYYD